MCMCHGGEDAQAVYTSHKHTGCAGLIKISHVGLTWTTFGLISLPAKSSEVISVLTRVDYSHAAAKQIKIITVQRYNSLSAAVFTGNNKKVQYVLFIFIRLPGDFLLIYLKHYLLLSRINIAYKYTSSFNLK